MAQLPLVYDPRYQSWDFWSGLMVEAYAAQQLQIGVPEDKWQEFAAGMMAIDVFQNEALPNPYLFSDWREWVFAIIGAINPREN